MHKFSSKIVLGLLLATGVASAAEESAPKVAPNWWQMSSYAHAKSDGVLLHTAGTIAYQESEGNTKENSLKMRLSATARYEHFTYYGMYQKTDVETKSYGSKDAQPTAIKDDVYSFENALTYDVNKYLFTTVGYDNSRDISMEIYNKNVYYGGLGVRALNTPHHKLSLFAAYGNEDISFGTYPILPSGESDGVYYALNYRWLINEQLMFTFKYRFLDAVKKYRNTSTLNTALNIKVYDGVSVVLAYEDVYVEGMKLVNLFEHDKKFTTALRFDFNFPQ